MRNSFTSVKLNYPFKSKICRIFGPLFPCPRNKVLQGCIAFQNHHIAYLLIESEMHENLQNGVVCGRTLYAGKRLLLKAGKGDYEIGFRDES